MSIFTNISILPKRNYHKLGFQNDLTMQHFGVLYPMLCVEGVPGQVINHKHVDNLFFFPQFANVQHSYRLMTYYFYVPYRIIYWDWDKFFSQVNGQYQTPFVAPYVQWRDLYNRGTNHQWVAPCSLSDYLGVASLAYAATGQGGEVVNPLAWDSSDDDKLNTLPFRAYQKIWVDHFMDPEANYDVSAKSGLENIFPHGGGELVADFSFLFCLRSKCWNFDKFTTALKNTHIAGQKPTVSGTIDVDNLRELFSLNSFIELMARTSQRPQDLTHALYGVYPKDYRIDQAEFIRATSCDIVKGQILNHDAAGSSGLDDAQGFPVSTFRGGNIGGDFKYKPREHGLLIGLSTVVPQAKYFQGTKKLFRKLNPTDYYIPNFDNLGDQMVRNDELYQQVGVTSAEQTQNKSGFGFEPRYAELKYYDNEIHGYYRRLSYMMYHDAKQFSSLPSRNSRDFSHISNYESDNSGNAISDPCNLNRIFNVPVNSPKIGYSIYHQFHQLDPWSNNQLPRFSK